jgi:hypothetical protein
MGTKGTAFIQNIISHAFEICPHYFHVYEDGRRFQSIDIFHVPPPWDDYPAMPRNPA